MFICNRTIYFKNNLCLQKGITVCIEICKLAQIYDIELKFLHSYFGENDRGMFTWKTESLDAMDEKFKHLFHDSGYQTLNQKITELTLDRSSHDDIWRQIPDLSV